jgi:hypothetical protein
VDGNAQNTFHARHALAKIRLQHTDFRHALKNAKNNNTNPTPIGLAQNTKNLLKKYDMPSSF